MLFPCYAVLHTFCGILQSMASSLGKLLQAAQHQDQHNLQLLQYPTRTAAAGAMLQRKCSRAGAGASHWLQQIRAPRCL